MKLQFLWTHNRNVVCTPYACIWTYIQGERKVLQHLSEVRCRLECKWQGIYSIYGYNNCCRLLPRACDGGHVCCLKCFMCGTLTFQHNEAPFFQRWIGTFAQSVRCRRFLTTSILFMKACFRNVRFRLQNNVTECENFVPNSCVVRTLYLNIAMFVPLSLRTLYVEVLDWFQLYLVSACIVTR